MAELTPELYQQVRDFSRFKRDFTLDEIGRRAAIAAGIAGGMDPRAAQEYYLSQSPYRLTRSEFDAQLAQLMKLEEQAARVEAAAARGDLAASKAARSERQRSNSFQRDLALQALKNRNNLAAIEYESLIEKIDAFEIPQPTNIGGTVRMALTSLSKDQQLSDTADSLITSISTTLEKLPPGATSEQYLSDLAALRDQSLDEFITELKSEKDPNNPRLRNLYNLAVKKVSEEPREIQEAKQRIGELNREAWAGWGIPNGTEVVDASTRAASAKGRGEQPAAEDVSIIQRAITEFPEEGPPIRMERERLQRGPEFQQFMEEFYERDPLSSTEKTRLAQMEAALAEDPEALSEEASAEYQQLKSREEDRPFSDIEQRMGLRAARTQARKQARGERREGRQRLRALRKGDDFLRDEDFEDVPETRPGAQLAVPAAAKDTTATGVGEQPDINAYTTFKPKGDTHIYRTQDGINWEAARKETPNKFVKIKTYEEDASGNLVYTRNPESGELLLEIMYDKFKDSKERGELGEEGPSLDKETTETFFGSDVFEEVRAAAPKGKAPAPKVEPETGLLAVEEDEQEIAPIEDIDPVVSPRQEFTEEQFQAVEEATGRAPRPSFGQMIFEDARSRYPQVPPAQVAPEPAPAPAPPPVPEPPEPGSDEELLQNIYAQQAAEAERMSRAAEVFDTPPENPEGTILQDTTERTTEEVLAGQTPGREAGQEAASQARQQAGAATAGVFSKRVQDEAAKNILKMFGRNK